MLLVVLAVLPDIFRDPEVLCWKDSGLFSQELAQRFAPRRRGNSNTLKKVFFVFFFSYFTRQELPAECQLAKSPGKLHGALL